MRQYVWYVKDFAINNLVKQVKQVKICHFIWYMEKVRLLLNIEFCCILLACE